MRDIFRPNPYKTTFDIGNANTLMMETVLDFLSNYKNSKMEVKGKDDCFLFLKKKTKRDTIDNPISN
jgi:hypothetical protein